MMNDYFDNWLDAWGIGRKDSSLKKKIKHHQDRHVELMFSYQELCQNTFNAMVTSSMKGDINAIQKAHKQFLEGLNKTFESMFANHIELASQAPEKMGQVLNLHRANYEKLFDNLPQIKQIKSQIDRNDMMNSMKKLALGTMSAVLASVAMPSKGFTSLVEPDRDTIAASVMVAQAPLEYRSYEQIALAQRTHVICPTNFAADQVKPSKINQELCYPKMTMLHPYNPLDGERIDYGIASVPLIIFLNPDYHANLPAVLKNRLAQAGINPARTKIMVNAQNFPWIDGAQISLRPHYATDPNAPARATKAQPVWISRNITAGIVDSTNNELFLADWVVRPGGNPANGADYIVSDKSVNSFNPFTIVTHGDPAVDISDVVLSGIAPFVKGLSTRGQSFWSYVSYRADDGQDSALATLHLVLTDAQLKIIPDVLKERLTQRGDPIQNLLDVVNSLQRTQEFNDGSKHLEKLAELMGFIAPKVTYNIQQTNDTRCELEGLSGPELTHRWSEVQKPKIKVPIEPGAQTLSLNTFSYIPGNHVQKATVSINNNPLGAQFIYDQAHPSKIITAVIPYGIKDAVCEFDIPTLLSPGASDPRLLGLAFRGIEESLPYSMSRTAQYFIGQNKDFPFMLVQPGFSVGEGTHRWTNGDTATIRIPLDADINRRPHAITFLNAGAFTPGNHTQLVNIKLNGVLVSQHIFSAAQNAQTIKVPLPINLVGETTLEFEMPNAISTVGDTRKLGLRFHEVVLSYLR